jgi:hypothetical protein
MATVNEDPVSSGSSQQEDIETIIKTSLDQNKDQQIAAILVVGFHHAYGPIVEFCVPPLPYHHNQSAQVTLEKLELPEEWSFLPFLALPGLFYKKREWLKKKKRKRFANSFSIFQQQRWSAPKRRGFCILSLTTCTWLVCSRDNSFWYIMQ